MAQYMFHYLQPSQFNGSDNDNGNRLWDYVRVKLKIQDNCLPFPLISHCLCRLQKEFQLNLDHVLYPPLRRKVYSQFKDKTSDRRV